MFTGARVIVKSNKDPSKGFFGIVTGRTGSDMISVHFDDGKDHVVKPQRLKLVYYFKKKTAAVALDKVDVLPDQEISAKDYFNAKRATVYDETLVTGIWYWANKEIFDNELKPIEIIVTSRVTSVVPKMKFKGEAGGVYYPAVPRKNPTSKLVLNKNLTTISRVTEITIHEMVHQYNVEVDVPAGRFDRSIHDAHGKMFMRFAPKIKKVADIDLNKFVNMQDFPLDDIDERAEKFHNTKTKKYWIVVYTRNGIVYSARFSSLDAAIEIYHRMRMNPHNAEIYNSTHAELANSIRPGQIKGTLFAAEPKIIENIKKFATKE